VKLFYFTARSDALAKDAEDAKIIFSFSGLSAENENYNLSLRSPRLCDEIIIYSRNIGKTFPPASSY
jgi:hypothetical protein